MLDEISLDDLTNVTGGASWAEIRQQAAPHCPQTVAAHPNAPKNRAQAQSIANQCVAEMPGWKQGFARPKLQAGIDEAFPR